MQTRLDKPSFSSILWDNAKTISYKGTVVAGAPGGASFILGFFGLIGIIGASDIGPDPANVLAGIYTAGTVTLGAPIATAGAVLLSVPFSIASMQTRKFKANQEIDPLAEKLLAENDDQFKAFLIAQIIDADKNSSWWGARSYESAQVMFDLENSALTLDAKWQTLLNYINDKSGDAYVNNGKKLFNAILNVVAVTASTISLEKAVKNGHTSEVISLIEQGVTLGTKYHNVINMAAVHGSLDTLKALLDYTDTNDNALSACPISYAAASAQISVVSYLVNEKGVDINKVNDEVGGEFFGKTPVQCADASGKHDFASQLVTTLGANDSEMDNLRTNLKNIIGIIRSPDWENEGTILFFRVLPHGVIEFRQIIGDTTVNDVENLSREKVLQLTSQLKERGLSRKKVTSSSRSEHTKSLYEAVCKIDENVNFDSLATFTSSVSPR